MDLRKFLNPKKDVKSNLAKIKLRPHDEEDSDIAEDLSMSSVPDDEDEEEDLADDAEELVATVAARVASGRVDTQLKKLLNGYDPGEQPVPPWAEDDLWEKAVQAVDPDGDGANYDDPYLVVGAVYKKLGGAVNPGT